jgi:hypothetical protein
VENRLLLEMFIPGCCEEGLHLRSWKVLVMVGRRDKNVLFIAEYTLVQPGIPGTHGMY